MQFKFFEEEDAVDVLETLLVSWISSHHDLLPAHAFEDVVSRINMGYVKHFQGKRRFCLVLREHRKVMGFIYCTIGSLYASIEQLHVRPEKQHKGLTEELLAKACEELLRRNQIKVRAYVLAADKEGLEFYRKQGFLSVKRALNPHFGNVLEVSLEKNLQGVARNR